MPKHAFPPPHPSQSGEWRRGKLYDKLPFWSPLLSQLFGGQKTKEEEEEEEKGEGEGSPRAYHPLPSFLDIFCLIFIGLSPPPLFSLPKLISSPVDMRVCVCVCN